MLKKILLASIFVISAITNVAHAEDDMKTVASKAYVDTKIETKQLKIPAAGQPNVGAGETVMTYTATGNGQIGERGLYSDISSYDATTDGDKLITASALNATFTNLPTTDTTKLECANSPACTLWTIVDQNAYYKPSRNLLDMSTIVRYKAIQSNGTEVPVGVNYAHSAFIPVEPNTTYTISNAGNVSAVVTKRGAQYSAASLDSYVASIEGVTGENVTFTTRANTNYIIVNVNVTSETAQVEKGSSATPYEPYY